ncbi:uncharacterized protein LOC122669991 isoform X2 [Telopea speciosissima]|uniref:uncharacterized protein LOC122669991 isoform X2 n=1 Tax=Telopea speciosissima TaxID=54955 RepID=UPI001CC3AA35|nr:uncharacterized protein LOC122669991 isoform X2 [Telopea speciosissima]
MADQMVTLMCHWEGRITTGSQGPDYEGGRLKGIRVNNRTTHLELLGKMYEITGYGQRQFLIKMICRFPVSRGYIAYEIDDNDSTEIMLELGRKQTFVGVELYLEKYPLHIDNERNNPLSTSIPSKDTKKYSLSSLGNADNWGSPLLGGLRAGTGGCLGSGVGLVQCSSQQYGMEASDDAFDCLTVGYGEEGDEWSQAHVVNMDEELTVNCDWETEKNTLVSGAIVHAHVANEEGDQGSHVHVANGERDEDSRAHVSDVDEGAAADCEWEMNESEGNTLVSKAILHAANEDGDERAHVHVADVDETGGNASVSEAIAHAQVANEDKEVGHAYHVHEDVDEEVVMDCEQEVNETEGNALLSEAIAHAQVGNEDEEVPHGHLANEYVQVDVDPVGERHEIERNGSLSVVVSSNNFADVEQGPANEFTNNDWVNDAVASNHVPGFPVVLENVEAGLHVGQIFQTKQQLQHIMKEYAIKAHREYIVLESTPSLLALKCKNEGCPWRLRAPLKKSVGCFMITKYAGPHTCVNPSTDQDHAQLDAEFICSKILGMVKEHVSITPAAIMEHMQQTYDYSISYMKAWTAKQKALEKIFGDCKESYVVADLEFPTGTSFSDEVVPALEASVDPLQPFDATEGMLQLTQLTEDEHDAAIEPPCQEKRKAAKRKR